MFKKAFTILAFTGILGVLVFGGINRTLAKSGSQETGSGNTSHQSETGSGNTSNQGETAQGTTGQGEQNQQQNAALGSQAVQGDPNHTHEAEAALPPADPDGLTEDEIAGLVFMREEEKLARDVYLAMYSLWNQPVFQNIASSEQSHMDAILTLLNRYGIPDPASPEVGVFNNHELQDLYTNLVAWGDDSLIDALLVGGAIEEIDILDIQALMDATDKVDIIQVYQSLLDGSENHLRAFVSQYEKKSGETYVPQYLDMEVYLAIINADSDSGQGGGNRNNRGSQTAP